MSGNNNKCRKHNFIIWLVATVLVATSHTVFIQATRNGVQLNDKNNKAVSTYDSIAEFVSDCDLDLSIPDYVLNLDNLKYENTYNQIYSIYNDTNVLKVSAFIDVNADPLGLYEEASIDNKYEVEDSEITFFRYRYTYKDFPNCTIINWCTNEISYGLMIEKEITEDEALAIINLSRENISILDGSTDNSSGTEEELSYKQYTINNSIKVLLPDVESEIIQQELDGAEAFYMNNKPMMIVVYDKEVIKSEAYRSNTYKTSDKGIEIDYNSENPFEEDSSEYGDYEAFLSSIEYICNTIVVD